VVVWIEGVAVEMEIWVFDQRRERIKETGTENIRFGGRAK
jgi:hypothetical protein